MPDMENVINGLNDIGGFIAGRVGLKQARNFLRTIDDTIELLKEQEPKPIKDRFKLPNLNVKFGGCPKCNASLDDRQYPYSCGFCGQAVKWE